MTSHLTKPIQAIHFMGLAFLMTLSAHVSAQDFQKGLAKGSNMHQITTITYVYRSSNDDLMASST